MKHQSSVIEKLNRQTTDQYYMDTQYSKGDTEMLWDPLKTLNTAATVIKSKFFPVRYE